MILEENPFPGAQAAERLVHRDYDLLEVLCAKAANATPAEVVA